MKRFAVTALMALFLWGLVPVLGEILEDALHFVQEGHSAHAAPDGDHHDPTGPEHGCTGAVHHCSCCVSLSFLATRSGTPGPARDSGEFVPAVSTHVPARSVGSVYRPPRV